MAAVIATDGAGPVAAVAVGGTIGAQRRESVAKHLLAAAKQFQQGLEK
jgi:hypothetical protein